MNPKSKVIKLKRAKKYHTYQFYAEMDNKNIDLKDGLKIAALTCLNWLKNKVDVEYNELNVIPVDDYKKATNDSFKSFSIGSSYFIKVISLFDEGKWALKIIENDTGNIGTKGIVPGRSIITNISFCINDDKLECGVKITINDLADVELADNIRPIIVYDLGLDSRFGFKQLDTLFKNGDIFIENDKSLNAFKQVLDYKDNQLPIVVYTYDDGYANIMNDNTFNLKKNLIDYDELPKDKQEELLVNGRKENDTRESKAKSYSRRYIGKARPYYVPSRYFKEFEQLLNISCIISDQIIVILPKTREIKRFNYNCDPEKSACANLIDHYTRNLKYNYHNVLFFDELDKYYQNKMDAKNEDYIKSLQDKINQYIIKESQNSRKDRKENYVPDDDINAELENVRNIVNTLKNDNGSLKKQIIHLKDELDKKNLVIDFYKRKNDFPKTHKEIAKWAEDNLKYVILNKKAIMCLENNDATKIDADKICEALDYLDNIYSKSIFFNKSDDYLNIISSNTYNRPYDVSPSGIKEPCRGECKIKYAFDGEKSKEHILDQHLRVGKHGTNLIRIYFLVDKDRKKIVIGSLPKHL